MSDTPLLRRLFSWLRPARSGAQVPLRPGSGVGRGEGASASRQREQRAVRRAQLVELVKAHMAAGNIDAAAYKFKVLARDTAGQIFNVLIDVDAEAMATDPGALRQHEQALQALARKRWGMEVQGIYWRFTVAAGRASGNAVPAPEPSPFTLPDVAPHRAPEWVRRDFAPTQPMERPEADPKP